ncbi:MAG: ATP-binding protein [Bacteroidales bacterium]
MQFERTIHKIIKDNLFKGKVIVLYGARRVGKTTLSMQLIANEVSARYINCELLQNKTALETTNTELLRSFIGSATLVVLDEAQHISNIGLILKVLVDTFPEIQFVATGSSSFELGQKISEPLTGRSRVYYLAPLSVEEINQHFDSIAIKARIETILRFGSYPDVFNKSDSEAIEELNNIASNYLYKDVLAFEQLKRSDLLINLLRAIALQLGNELSYSELSRLLGENIHTIKRYIELLEKAFVIFRLHSLSRNPRKEIAKGQKIYFYDLGIRNSLIQNYNSLNMRNDAGGLWENFCIIERMKYNNNHRHFVNSYFWRTYDQKEIDYIEEEGGKFFAFEFKFNQQKILSAPKEFLKNYPESEYSVITSENFWNFVM